MMENDMLTLDDFNFDLPEALIALRPLRPRPASRMLVWDAGSISDQHVSNLVDHLGPNDLLVFNNTKVIPARLNGARFRQTADGSGLAKIESTLIERLGPDSWLSLSKPAKRLAVGDPVEFSEALSATVIDKNGGEVLLQFNLSGEDLDREIEAIGTMPLPPYIASKRAADAQDMLDYQTVFASRTGAVAAPTASLHFDEDLLAQLAANGVQSTEVTLHVGAGTFLPVKVENIAEHKMHAEWGEVTEAAAQKINDVLANGGRVIPVGTTALRLIESAAAGYKKIAPWTGTTDIFIAPGYRFNIASGLMTNFHLPKSTLMMLVSALVGLEETRTIYRHAITQKYRFFSYGDSSLLLPNVEQAA